MGKKKASEGSDSATDCIDCTMGALSGLRLPLMKMMLLLLYSNELTMMPMTALSPSHH